MSNTFPNQHPTDNFTQAMKIVGKETTVVACINYLHEDHTSTKNFNDLLALYLNKVENGFKGLRDMSCEELSFHFSMLMSDFYTKSTNDKLSSVEDYSRMLRYFGLHKS